MIFSSATGVVVGTAGVASTGSTFPSTGGFAGGGGVGIRKRTPYRTANERRNAMSTLFSISEKQCLKPGPNPLDETDGSGAPVSAICLLPEQSHNALSLQLHTLNRSE